MLSALTLSWLLLVPGTASAYDKCKESNGITMLRPRLSVGLTRFLNARSPTSTAVFAGSPNGVSVFETSSKLKRTYLALDAGLEMTANQGWSLSLSRFGQLSGDIKSYGGSLQVAIPF